MQQHQLHKEQHLLQNVYLEFKLVFTAKKVQLGLELIFNLTEPVYTKSGLFVCL